MRVVTSGNHGDIIMQSSPVQGYISWKGKILSLFNLLLFLFYVYNF